MVIVEMIQAQLSLPEQLILVRLADGQMARRTKINI